MMLLALMPKLTAATFGIGLCSSPLQDEDLLNMKLDSTCLQEYCDNSMTQLTFCELSNSCCSSPQENFDSYVKCRACSMQAQNNILNIDFNTSSHFDNQAQLNNFTDLTFYHQQCCSGSPASTSVLYTSFTTINEGGNTVTFASSLTETYYETVTGAASTVYAPIPKITRTYTQNEISYSTLTLEPSTVTLEASTVTMPASTVTMEASTVTMPGSTMSGSDITETLPASTITMQGSTVTMEASTVTQSASTITESPSTITVSGSDIYITSLVPTTISEQGLTITSMVPTTVSEQGMTVLTTLTEPGTTVVSTDPTTITQQGTTVT